MDGKFSVICNTFLKDKTLSAGAKGVFAYLVIQPRDRKFTQDDVFGHFANGKEPLKHFLVELMERGYLERTAVKDGNGKFLRFEYMVILEPNGKIK